MLGTQFVVRTVSGLGIVPAADESHSCRPLISNHLVSSSSSPSCHFQIQLKLRIRNRSRRRSSKSFPICCKSVDNNGGGGSFSGRSSDGDEFGHDHDYIEASLLVSETIRHYNMRRNGYGYKEEEVKWKPYGRLLPFSVQSKESKAKAEVDALGLGLLRQFRSPTIFLKISCDGDFVLPISVGELAVETLIDAFREDESGHCANHFQFLRNLVEKLGYQVKMVRITERVINTYFARIYFSKPGERDTLSVDARPSDAINVAKRCEAPIYVNKQIVRTDAIRVMYGMGRLHDRKSIYDVTLDSPADGPDLVAEELDLVRNMNSAVEEERYNDAAILRDKLVMLRESGHGH